MYFGGTIMTFALPMGAFIVAAIALFYLFRAQHSGPRLRYLAGAAVQPRSAPGSRALSRPRRWPRRVSAAAARRAGAGGARGTEATD